MAVGEYYTQHSNDLADGADFTLNGSEGGTDRTGAIEIHEIIYSGDADVFYEVDVDNDGTFEISIKVDTLQSNGIKRRNGVKVNSHNDQRIRINNTSGSAQDYVVNGIEIDA